MNTAVDIVIKRIYLADIAIVIGLFDRYRVFYKQQSDITLAKSFLAERLKSDESVIFAATINDIPVGFTQLYPKYSSARAVKNWILNDLYVEQQYRKNGIGKQLINTAGNFAKENNAKFVQLETAIDNYTAQQLYESTGFIKQTPDTAFIMYRKNVDNNQ